jgi:transketolase
MRTGVTVTSERAAIEKLAVNTIRTQCMDAVQAANSGHPGSPMGMAPTAYVCGSASSASTRTKPFGATATASCSPPGTARRLYALLHLTGVKAVMDRV